MTIKNIFILLFLLLIIGSFSCEDEPVDFGINLENTIAVDSELYNLIEEVVIIEDDDANDQVCVNFNYPFTLLIYDEELFLIDSQVIIDNDAFSTVLSTLDSLYSISLSYPVISYFDNGESISINNNKELKQAIDRCLEEDFYNYCNDTLPSENCIWEVTYLNAGENIYDDAFFTVNKNGTITFNYNDNTFNGTWTTLYIEDETHLNINLIDNTQVGTDWNFDWLISLTEDDDFLLENGSNSYILKLNCDLSCIDLTFEECEAELNSGIAEFDLESYTECILSFTEVEDNTSVIVSFYESQEDAETSTNALNPPYTNTENYQTLVVRIEDIATGEPIFISITIEATNC